MECFESFFAFIKDAIGAACICQTRREGRVLQTVMNGKIEEDVKKIYINKSNDSESPPKCYAFRRCGVSAK
ncbi:Uncharacterised protein [uncultured Clostridium sp.]|nr:Uncharacterised protein [uncultured Clostridium sp.]